MAYPPPPGIGNLPARPPASRGGFKPAFSSAPQPAAPPYANSAPSYPGAPSNYGAPPAQAAQYGTYPGSAGGVSTSSANYSQPQQPAQSYGAQSYGSQSYGQASYAAPQIRNPFPLPGQPGSDFDPEMAAQIAQWQSTYVSRDATKDAKTPGSIDSPKPDVQPVMLANPDKKKTVLREGGGKKWTDETLLEWDPAHLRLFVGNLAGETTDDSLLKAFARWKSVQKARVIRDKRTSKSKGFGFVSFSDADDFFQAAKEMNGKYIQSHPVVIRKANTEIKHTNVKEQNTRKNNKYKNKNKGGYGSGHGGGHGGGHGSGHGGGNAGGNADGNSGGYQPSLGPIGAVGVTKPGQKTKNGLRLLG